MAKINVIAEGYAASIKSVRDIATNLDASETSVTTIQQGTAVAAAATDAAETQALVNELRVVLIAAGIVSVT